MTLGNRSVRLRPLNFARTIWMIGVLAALTGIAAAQLPSHGPTKGYLLITGGATQPPDYQRFIEMAGGKNARIVVIPTASVTKPTDQAGHPRDAVLHRAQKPLRHRPLHRPPHHRPHRRQLG